MKVLPWISRRFIGAASLSFLIGFALNTLLDVPLTRILFALAWTVGATLSFERFPSSASENEEQMTRSPSQTQPIQGVDERRQNAGGKRLPEKSG